MMKYFTPFLIVFVLSTGTNAQTLYNGGFEQINSDGSLSNWGNVYLVLMWIDSLGNSHTDSIVHDGPYYAPTNDALNGYSALELRNAWNFTANKGISGAVGNDDDSIFSSYGLFNMVPTYATQFNPFQPFNFGLHYKYTPVNGDTAYAQISLWDSSGNELGSSLILITDSSSTYTEITSPINYINSNVVDFYTLSIGTFYSVDPGSHDPSFGTRLTVDDIGFNFVSAIVEDIDKSKQFSAYPNPASDYIILKSKSTSINSAFKLLDISGKEMLAGIVSGENMQISLQDYESGIYFLKADSEVLKIVVSE